MPLPSVRKVIVIGELNLDLIFADSNIVPAPNREKLVRDFRLALGSSSAIAAAGLAGLGLEVAFVSIVGDDEFGQFCLRELARLGVDVTHVVVDSSVRTGVTLSLTDGRDRSLLTFMGSIGSAALLAYTDWFIPSEEEALQIFEADSVEELPARLPVARGAVIVKCGSAGSDGSYADGRVEYSPPFAVQPVDTTGAGDSFNAGFIAAKLRGESVRAALAYANACGALSTLAIGGAGTVTLGGVAKFWPEGRWLA